MPVVFSHHPEDWCLEAKWTGLVADSEIVAQIASYLNSTTYIPGTHELVDLSTADLSKLSVEALDRVADMFSQIHKFNNFERKKLAFYAPTSSSFAATNIYKSLCDSTAENVSIFSDKGEAESWLRADDT